MKTTSCGILVCHPGAELLLCHATGTAHWDIPKGSGEAEETTLQTAMRETAEECALQFAPADLLELGRFPYRPGKDLHLYAALIERVDPGRCRCSTRFRDRLGRERPETDAFEWVPFARIGERCAKKLTALLSSALPLTEVLQRLQARGVVAPARWLDATVRD